MFNPLSMQALGVFQQSGILTPNAPAAIPEQPGMSNNNYLISNGTNVQPVNKLSIKGDHIFNEKHRISGYYGHDREAIVSGPGRSADAPGQSTPITTTCTRPPMSSASVGTGLSAQPSSITSTPAETTGRQNHKPPQEYIGNWKSKFCLGNVPDCNENLVNLFSGGNGDTYTTWGGQANNGSENTVYSYNDDFTWIKGAHTFKFGRHVQINHYNGFGRQCEAGCVGFSYTETGVPGGTDPTQGRQRVRVLPSRLCGFRTNRHGSFHRPTVLVISPAIVQDDWHVNRKRLFVNLGVRWETNLPPTGLNDRWSDFSPTTPNPAAGGISWRGFVRRLRPRPRRLAHSGRFLFRRYRTAHRLRLFTLNEKTVIRGSYARSFGPLMAVTGSTHNMGFTLTDSLSNPNNGLQPLFLLNQGFPAYNVPPFINPSVSNGTRSPGARAKRRRSRPRQTISTSRSSAN